MVKIAYSYEVIKLPGDLSVDTISKKNPKIRDKKQRNFFEAILG
jgi:hypothetical protein